MGNKACKISSDEMSGEYGRLMEEMGKDIYWIHFFARPCCPAPEFEGACNMLDRLADEARAREDFTEEQRANLVSVIEARKEWYPHSGLCRR